MPQDVWIKFYGRGVEKTAQCYNKIKSPVLIGLTLFDRSFLELSVPGVLSYLEVGGGGAWPQNLPLKFLLEPQILPPKIKVTNTPNFAL